MATIMAAIGARRRITRQSFQKTPSADSRVGTCKLTDAHNGDVRGRKEVSERLGHDVRQGAHARKVMQFYQTWFGEGPELSLLHILGLFDRPADQKAIDSSSSCSRGYI